MQYVPPVSGQQWRDFMFSVQRMVGAKVFNQINTEGKIGGETTVVATPEGGKGKGKRKRGVGQVLNACPLRKTRPDTIYWHEQAIQLGNLEDLR